MPKVIYIAGKYTGDSDWETYSNIHHARVQAHRLWNEGWAVICPHANTAFFGGPESHEIDWEKWLGGDLEILRRCDAVFMLNNWEDSKGAKAELKEAKRMGIDIYFEPS